MRDLQHERQLRPHMQSVRGHYFQMFCQWRYIQMCSLHFVYRLLSRQHVQSHKPHLRCGFRHVFRHDCRLELEHRHRSNPRRDHRNELVRRHGDERPGRRPSLACYESRR